MDNVLHNALHPTLYLAWCETSLLQKTIQTALASPHSHEGCYYVGIMFSLLTNSNTALLSEDGDYFVLEEFKRHQYRLDKETEVKQSFTELFHKFLV